MKNVFIETRNVQTFETIMGEARQVMKGQPGLLEVTGRAGRGKTETAKRFCARNTDVIYVSYIGTWTPMSMLRSICWEIAAVKPGRSTTAWEIISDAMAVDRKVIIIDEADRMPPKLLNLVRDCINEVGNAFILIGEESLSGNLGRIPRMYSQIRRRVRFEPIGQPDLVQLYKQGLGVSVDPDAVAVLAKSCEGDFRPALVDAYEVERILRENKLETVTGEVAQAAVEQRGGVK